MKPSEALDSLIQNAHYELIRKSEDDVFIFAPMYFITLLLNEFTNRFNSDMKPNDNRIKNLHYRGLKVLINPYNELTICTFEYALNGKETLKHTIKL